MEFKYIFDGSNMNIHNAISSIATTNTKQILTVGRQGQQHHDDTETVMNEFELAIIHEKWRNMQCNRLLLPIPRGRIAALLLYRIERASDFDSYVRNRDIVIADEDDNDDMSVDNNNNNNLLNKSQLNGIV